MIVYVLVPTAVYDHGIVGVYETEDEARAAAHELWDGTDGHHDFVIVPRRLGHTHRSGVFREKSWREDDPGEPRVSIRP